ncbi:MAG: hypothetical protein LWW97_04585 [Deltaproteobacteria bacterium]|nr:hypothetical protein [Deltaproteobacteria bacterium]
MSKHKKVCWFIKLLDNISKDVDIMGDKNEETMKKMVEYGKRTNKALGLPPEAKNAKRFL